jgi:hypothetical protein
MSQQGVLHARVFPSDTSVDADCIMVQDGISQLNHNNEKGDSL